LLYTAYSMLPNFLMFLVWPSLLISFLSNNITTSLVTTFSIFPSGSLARLLSILFPIPFLPVAFTVFVIAMPVIILLFLKFNKNMNIFDQAVIAFTCGIVVFPDFYPGHSVIFWGLFLLWLATRNDYVDGTFKTIYFMILFFLTLSVLNWFYAITFVFLLISLLAMFCRSSSRNLERKLSLYHVGSKLLIPLYICSFVDVLFILAYSGVIG
jgi:hypothetical protein